MLLVVPSADETPWPTLGPDICDFLEDRSIYGPGSLKGQPYIVDDEYRAQLYKAYEVYPAKASRTIKARGYRGHDIVSGKHPLAGRRRFKRVGLSVRKGLAKTEKLAQVAELAIASTEPKKLEAADGSEVYSLITANDKHRLFDLEEYRFSPRRVKGTVRPATLDSFVAYCNVHKNAYDGCTTIWVSPTQYELTAVLNDHGYATAQWGDHRAILKLAKTAEWSHWLSQDGKLLSQQQFAEHVEEGLAEIAQPDAATLLEVAQTLHGTTKVEWRSSTRLGNGETQLQYVEEVETGGGRSRQLEVPTVLVLGICPFLGEPRATLTARLRTRMDEGKLRVGYKLDRPDEVLLTAVNDLAQRLSQEHGFDHVYLGTPRA